MAQKIRIGVTVDKATVVQFKADLKTLKLPPATLSSLVDEWLQGFAPTLRVMAEKKSRGEQMSFDEVIQAMADIVKSAMKP